MASEFQKADKDLVERIEAATALMPVYRKNMFGSTSWFMESNDQIFAGVWGSDLLVRVSESEAKALIDSNEANAFDPMGGRPMREHVMISGETVADDQRLSDWLERGASFAMTLAPKPKKTKKNKKS